MVKKTRLLTDAVREIWHTRSRFLSILVLSALAVCFLAGLRATEPDMKNTALLIGQLREEHHLHQPSHPAVPYHSRVLPITVSTVPW